MVRAWSEDGQLRVRMVRDGSDGPAQIATGSSSDAARQLLDWLQQFQAADEPAGTDEDDASEPD